ncbi:hypothetical protein CH378_08640 [Leptospira kmetyi]|uniref:Uncharacterized protein n=1 Tax=Leptospira kmetyi TaxID=408139 RepID=A0ABX4NAF2_9LEPT|nr:hypothetical protein CH378_08640 [Leptospira kmetyi]
MKARFRFVIGFTVGKAYYLRMHRNPSINMNILICMEARFFTILSVPVRLLPGLQMELHSTPLIINDRELFRFINTTQWMQVEDIDLCILPIYTVQLEPVAVGIIAEFLSTLFRTFVHIRKPYTHTSWIIRNRDFIIPRVHLLRLAEIGMAGTTVELPFMLLEMFQLLILIWRAIVPLLPYHPVRL